MINLAFSVNGKDFSGMVYKYGYKTGREPVISETITTLDGVDHEMIARWRSTLTVTLNAATLEQTAAFAAEVMKDSCTVTYFNFQLGQEVTETMKFATISNQIALEAGGSKYLDQTKITFEQR